MSKLDLGPIKKRCEKATPGPWEASIRTDYNPDIYDSEDTHAYYSSGPWLKGPAATMKPQAMSDADFIAHARTDVPALVEEVERLMGALQAATDRYVFSERARANESLERQAEFESYKSRNDALSARAKELDGERSAHADLVDMLTAHVDRLNASVKELESIVRGKTFYCAKCAKEAENG